LAAPAACCVFVLLAEAAPNLSPIAVFRDVRFAGMDAKRNPGGLLNCGLAELGLVLAMVINNWQPAPLWVLLVLLVVVRISFLSLRRPLFELWQDVKQEVAQLLELRGDSTRGGPARVC
jgi:hypothetical protein